MSNVAYGSNGPPLAHPKSQMIVICVPAGWEEARHNANVANDSHFCVPAGWEEARHNEIAKFQHEKVLYECFFDIEKVLIMKCLV